VTNPSESIVTIPVEECTPLADIPKKKSYNSQVLELDDVVVVVGEYYYTNKIMAIDRRTNNRKRGESSIKKESYDKNIKWKASLDPKENKIQTTLALNGFVGENAMSLYELGEALDISRTRLVELEETLNKIK
jgi:hypothetical protein